eukprot:5814909-Amphidinium_carterae.1
MKLALKASKHGLTNLVGQPEIGTIDFERFLFGVITVPICRQKVCFDAVFSRSERLDQSKYSLFDCQAE